MEVTESATCSAHCIAEIGIDHDGRTGNAPGGKAIGQANVSSTDPLNNATTADADMAEKSIEKGAELRQPGPSVIAVKDPARHELNQSEREELSDMVVGESNETDQEDHPISPRG